MQGNYDRNVLNNDGHKSSWSYDIQHRTHRTKIVGKKRIKMHGTRFMMPITIFHTVCPRSLVHSPHKKTSLTPSKV